MGVSVLSGGALTTKSKSSAKNNFVEMESGMGEFDDRDSVSAEMNPPLISPKFGMSFHKKGRASQPFIRHKRNFSRGTESNNYYSTL